KSIDSVLRFAVFHSIFADQDGARSSAKAQPLAMHEDVRRRAPRPREPSPGKSSSNLLEVHQRPAGRSLPSRSFPFPGPSDPPALLLSYRIVLQYFRNELDVKRTWLW